MIAYTERRLRGFPGFKKAPGESRDAQTRETNSAQKQPSPNGKTHALMLRGLASLVHCHLQAPPPDVTSASSPPFCLLSCQQPSGRSSCCPSCCPSWPPFWPPFLPPWQAPFSSPRQGPPSPQ